MSSGRLRFRSLTRIVGDMTDDLTPHPIVRPIDILSGLGNLERAEMCQIIALIECVDGLFLAKGAVAGVGAKLGLDNN